MVEQFESQMEATTIQKWKPPRFKNGSHHDSKMEATTILSSLHAR
jgi:hypothetical protein